MRLAALVFLALTIVAGCSPAQPRTSESLAQSDLIVTNIETAPVEYQLSYLDAGQLPRGNDVNAARIRYLLKVISDQTGDSVQHIADRTSASTTVLKKDYGKAVTNQRFLEGANEYVLARGPKLDYDSLSGLLIVGLGK